MNKVQPAFKQVTVMLLLTVFQLISSFCVISKNEEFDAMTLILLMSYIAFEWLFMSFGNIITKDDYFELETIAFFLSGIGLVICASFSRTFLYKQLIAVVLGLACYLILLTVIKNVNFAEVIRIPVALISIGILIANLILAKVTNGTLNWVNIGPVSLQPSEIVKILFIFCGSISLDKLYSDFNLLRYSVYSLICVFCLFIMKDFGTALIFFFTFLLIAFMRSGNVKVLLFIVAVAFAFFVLIVYLKPYIADRFAAFRHVFEHSDDIGYQQSRVLVYSASGGLFGLGIGNGYLRDVFAASTDLVFGLICEEFGIAMAVMVVLSIVFIAVFAVKCSEKCGSTFFTIASVSAAGMLLFQLMLNVFGVTDLLPLTGVTLPFVSRGGSSMICSWCLLAYIKASGLPFIAPNPDLSVHKRKRSANANIKS